MELVSEAVAETMSSSTSVFALAKSACEEAAAHGLPSQFAIRIALEAVLGHGSDDAKAVAAAVQYAAKLQAAPVGSVLAILDVQGMGDAALNVMSVLVFSEALPTAALEEWHAQALQSPREALDRYTLTARLQPLLQWIRRPPDPAESHGSDGSDGSDGSVAEDDKVSTGDVLPTVWRPVACTSSCDWEPASAQLALNVELGPCREAVVVLDGLVSEALRAQLLGVLTAGAPSGACEPPRLMWERTTCDGAGLPPSWGLQPRLLRRLGRKPPPCVVEVQSRLAKLYPEYTVAQMCSVGGDSGGAGSEYHATPFVANAAVYGNCFQWHVDADPSSMPNGSWRAVYGDYVNGTQGKPLLVSLLVYLDEHWQKEWDAETLFCEPEGGVGLLVQPRPGRCVLMHQDVLHRVSTPSLLTRRPRYSLVWKLLFVPKAESGVHGSGELAAAGDAHGRETICRPEWGRPTRVP